MRKLQSLRAALVAAIPSLAGNPEGLLVFVEQGSVQCGYGANDSHQVSYTASITVLDFAADIALVTTALVRWLKIEQPEALQNPQTAAELITFEAEILSHTTVDATFRVKLSERVLVPGQTGPQAPPSASDPGSPNAPDSPVAPQWIPEPPAPQLTSDTKLHQLYIKDELVAQCNGHDSGHG